MSGQLSVLASKLRELTLPFAVEHIFPAVHLRIPILRFPLSLIVELFIMLRCGANHLGDAALAEAAV